MKTSVLIFPSEGSNAIELHDALSTCVNVKLYGASSVERQGRFLFENYIGGIPTIFEANFINEFNKILEDNHIDIIFPTHDTVALFLKRNESILRARIVSGDLKTVEVCRSKILTHEMFEDEDFIPKRYKSKNDNIQLPVFLKPDVSEGSKGAKIIQNESDLCSVEWENSLITEYLPGIEITVDCFTDKEGVLRYISPRSRDRVMAGMSVAGSIMPATDEIRKIAYKINSRLNFLGLWYFQLRADINGQMKLMEVSSRCSGTMCLTRAKGINLPLLSIYTMLGYNLNVIDNDYNVSMERWLIGSYSIDYVYDTIYVDFDDTITLNGKINTKMIAYLYQCRNLHKKIILLTRHAGNIYNDLASVALSLNLFDEIITIENSKTKSDYISVPKSIFIDNSYNERLDVANKKGIPVFDVDGVDFLLNYKC